jgi:hypothetical protein
LILNFWTPNLSHRLTFSKVSLRSKYDSFWTVIKTINVSHRILPRRTFPISGSAPISPVSLD